jgi:hypothetical protein
MKMAKTELYQYAPEAGPAAAAALRARLGVRSFPGA